MPRKTAVGTYTGKYRLKNPEKYIGDADRVVYRSSWERASFLWCEKNPEVVKWVSEEVVIPYKCPTDKFKGKGSYIHRYFVDLYLEMKNGDIIIVEIKPAKETRPPRKGKNRNKKRLVQETMTYMKNQAKWEAAEAFCKKHGWKFQIWTEKELKRKGILFG